MYFIATLTSDVPTFLQFVQRPVVPNATGPIAETSAPSTYKSELPTIPTSKVSAPPPLNATSTLTSIAIMCDFAGIQC